MGNKQPAFKLAPYKVGDKVKVYVKDSEGVPLNEQSYTFGVVTKVIDLVPTVEFKDLSELPIHKFNRFVGMNDIVWSGRLVNFRRVG